MDAIETKNKMNYLVSRKKIFNDYPIKALDGSINLSEFKEECIDILEYVRDLLVTFEQIPQPLVHTAIEVRNLTLSTISSVKDIMELNKLDV